MGKGKNFGKGKNLQAPSASPKSTKPKITINEILQKRKINKSQALVDLEKAETLTLQLLSVCADTTDQFAAMAQGDNMIDKEILETGSSPTASDVDDKNQTSDDETNSSNVSSRKHEQEHRHLRIKRNGKEFQGKLQQIHVLLAPHSKFILNYSSDQRRLDHEHANNEKNLDAKEKSEKRRDDEDKREEAANMYSSRLEMRLAIERRNLLRDILRVEKERRQGKVGEQETDNVVDGSLKRKRVES